MARRMQKMVLGIGDRLGVRAIRGVGGKSVVVFAGPRERQPIVVQFVRKRLCTESRYAETSHKQDRHQQRDSFSDGFDHCAL